MLLDRILKVIILLLGGLFVLLHGFALEKESAALSAGILVLLIILYSRNTRNNTIYYNKYFFYFLVTFTLAQLINGFSYYGYVIGINSFDIYYYYTVNILCILAYVFLIVRILKDLNLKELLKQFPIPIFILIILDIFCVSIITATTETRLTLYEYTLEYTYNAIVMVLLSVSLIGYMYRNDNKSMLLLIGSICIVFSEIIQLAYYYILQENNDLGFIFSFFLVVAFVFLYVQSQLQFTGPIEAYTDEV